MVIVKMITIGQMRHIRFRRPTRIFNSTPASHSDMDYSLSSSGKKLLDEISPELLLRHVHEISKYVRISGSKEESLSLRYVKRILRKYGLNVRKYSCPAYIGYPQHALLEILSPSRRTISGVSAALAPSTPRGGTISEIVYGGRPSDGSIAPDRCHDKLVLIEGFASPKVAKQCENSGATGEIFINDDQVHEGIVSVVWGAPRPENASLLPFKPCISISKADGLHLRRLLESGRVRAKLNTRTRRAWRKIPILVADLPGKREKGTFAMLSGHIDSWHFGAMDNAGANAAMLEVARLLSRHRKQLKRGLRVAFWSGHSHGRYAGSAWYADNFWLELERNCVVHVNLDSIGSIGATSLREAPVMAETRDIASLITEHVCGQKLLGSRFSRAGDQSFWGIGIPSIFMELSEIPLTRAKSETKAIKLNEPSSSGVGWWWHTKHDTTDKIDPGNLVRDTKIYTVLMNEICSRSILPFDYRKTAEEARRNLLELQRSGRGSFDLKPLIEQSNRLIKALSRFNHQIELSRAQDDERVNKTLMRLGRYLIPALYTDVGRFDHDLAVPIPPFPRLQAIRKVATLRKGSEAFIMLSNGLRRDYNFVAAALSDATDLVNEFLQRHVSDELMSHVD
jgi:hypothetical protein